MSLSLEYHPHEVKIKNECNSKIIIDVPNTEKGRQKIEVLSGGTATIYTSDIMYGTYLITYNCKSGDSVSVYSEDSVLLKSWYAPVRSEAASTHDFFNKNSWTITTEAYGSGCRRTKDIYYYTFVISENDLH